MFLNFEKWHGAKNDFLVVYIRETDASLLMPSLQRTAPKICSRDGSGVGADGILALHVQKDDQILPDNLSIINSDGSLAQHCGNGVRCAASSVLRRHRKVSNEKLEGVHFELEGRPMSAQFFLASHGHQHPLVSVDMGVCTVGSAVPFYPQVEAELKRVEQACGIKDLAADWEAAEIGNPHIVVVTPEANAELVRLVGPVLQKSPHWDGINVHLVREQEITEDDKRRAGNEIGHQITELYQVFVWERGAGPTMACGSGACAVAKKTFAAGFVGKGEWVGVDMPGGRLYVSENPQTGSMILAGPAKFVFEGSIEV